MRKYLLFVVFILSISSSTFAAIVYSGSQNVTLTLDPQTVPPMTMASMTINVAGSMGAWDDFRIDLWYDGMMGTMVPMGMMGMSHLAIYAPMGMDTMGMVFMGGIVGFTDMASGLPWASNLAMGSIIGPDSPLTNVGWAILSNMDVGQFGPDGGYIGLMIDMPNGSPYYGYLHILSQSDLSVTFDEWAHEDQSSTPIGAGAIHAQSSGADCDWDSGDPHKMHWPQEPDLSSTGVDVSMSIVTLADDFKCSSSGPINDIHIWGSFVNDDLPPKGPDSLTFEITIYSDIPAEGDNWSRPGERLWRRTFKPGEYSAHMVHDGPEGWYDPARERYYPDNHKQAYQYNFCIEKDPFIQEEGTIYWLVVDEVGPDNPYDADYKFGWKTTTRDLSWNDDAVYLIDGYSQWYEMTYPDEHEYKGQTLDLAFVITGDDTQREYDWSDAPDSFTMPGYPTMSYNNGANHKIVGPWLGDDTDFPDPELNGQPESNALGDDLDIEPLFSLGPPNDDEDGVSIPPMFQGQPADITLEANGGGGIVDAWIDFNGDMSWQASEQIYDSFLADGTHTISFNVPADAVIGRTFARFRISKEGFLYPWGPADSGEVEDYRVNIYDDCRQCTEQEFIRGDFNQDTQVDDADVTLITEYLLTGAPKPTCMDAADADDNGVVDIGDTTFLLHYVNGGGPPPPAPFPDCGPDPTDDTLTCDQYHHCPGGALVSPQYTKWIQLPDVTTNGIAIQIDDSDGYIRTIADDFECQIKSLLTDVHLWCAWVNDQRGVIKKIHLSIHSDDPAGPAGYDPDNLFSKPAPNALWEMDFLQGQFQETLYYTLPEPGENWWDPPWMSMGVDRQIWRIDIDIDPSNAFLQEGTASSPRIYWLDVHADTENGEFGWKTRRWPDHYMDDAVMDTGVGLLRTWQELRYPSGHPYRGSEQDSIDMAFCLTYTPEDPNGPTFMPMSHTQCPVAATKCPTTATRCPLANTQCPVAATKCPVAATRCPPANTQCPVAATKCPPVDTQCPPEETKCPLEITKCDIEETVCPIEDTRCPPLETECPLYETGCALYIETECPTIETQCPPIETQCPIVETKCDFYLETYCPIVETKCYPDIKFTQCPPRETYCPHESTKCPTEDTKCPVMDTECPVEDTKCPSLYTQCPPERTKCPIENTICMGETICFPIPTECGTTPTYCPAIETECPIFGTVCPVKFTECPYPPEPTKCPTEDTKCPVTDTKCPVEDTKCPVKFTECPLTSTLCIACITQLPDCGPATLTPACIFGPEGTNNSALIRKCPVIETKCPTVISKDLLAGGM